LQEWNLDDKMVSGTTDQRLRRQKLHGGLQCYFYFEMYLVTVRCPQDAECYQQRTEKWRSSAVVREVSENLQTLQELRDFLANRLAKSQRNAEEDELRPVLWVRHDGTPAIR